MSGMNRLTDTAIRALKPGPKITKIGDGAGLQLHVQTSGSKLWRYAYRFAGKPQTLSLGAYPVVGLAKARARRDQLRQALEDGRDPARVLRDEKKKAGEPKARTFKLVAERWFTARETGWTPTYAKRVWARVEGDLVGEFGHIAIEDLDRADLLSALRKIEARSAFEMAKRVRQYADDIFRFARAEGWVSANPADDLIRALSKNPPKKRRAALKAVEMPEFLEQLAAYKGEDVTRLAVRTKVSRVKRTARRVTSSPL